MRKVIPILGLLVLAGIALVFALPALVPADTIRQHVITQVKAATGRDLVVHGKVSVSVLPSLSVSLGDVSLSNPPNFRHRTMLSLSSLEIRLKFWPLLRRQIDVEHFILQDPVIALEVDSQGQKNWIFEAAPSPAPAASADHGPATSGVVSPAAAPSAPEISLGHVEILRGKFSYDDEHRHSRLQVDEVNAKLTLPAFDQPIMFDAAARWNGKHVQLMFEAQSARALLQGGATATHLHLQADPVLDLDWSGTIATAAPLTITGPLMVKTPALRDALSWLGTIVPAGSGWGATELRADLAVAGESYGLKKIMLSLDHLKLQGDVTVRTDGSRPALAATLAAAEPLDLRPYLSKADSQASAPPSPATPKATPPVAAGWSTTPYTLAALKMVDASLDLSLAGVRVPSLTLGQIATQANLQNGHLRLTVREVALYQGKGQGTITLDGDKGLAFEAGFSLNDVQVEAALQDIAAVNRLTGTAHAELAIRGRGMNEQQLVSSLSGGGQVALRDGAIRGINLAAMMRNIGSAFTANKSDQKTDFAALSGKFSINNGLVSNADLQLLSPLLRVDGAGTVDLPRQALQYRLVPKLVASLEGQGGKKDLSGLSVPVLIEGPWADLSFRPDLSAAIENGLGHVLTNALGGKAPAVDGAAPGGGPIPLLPQGLFGR